MCVCVCGDLDLKKLSHPNFPSKRDKVCFSFFFFFLKKNTAFTLSAFQISLSLSLQTSNLPFPTSHLRAAASARLSALFYITFPNSQSNILICTTSQLQPNILICTTSPLTRQTSQPKTPLFAKKKRGKKKKYGSRRRKLDASSGG